MSGGLVRERFPVNVQRGPASTSTIRAVPKPKPSANSSAKVRELEQANEALQKQLQAQERTMATLKARADRAAAVEATAAKVKAENEKLTADLAVKAQKIQNLDKRFSETATRLFQAESKNRSFEVEIGSLEMRIESLTNAHAGHASSAGPSNAKLMTEIADLKEELGIAEATRDATEADGSYQRELERENQQARTDYAKIVDTFSAKNEQILQLQENNDELQRKLDQQSVIGTPDDQAMMINYLRLELAKRETAYQELEYDAMNAKGRFKHLKHLTPKPVEIPALVEMVGQVDNNLPAIPEHVQITVNLTTSEAGNKNKTFLQRMRAAVGSKTDNIQFKGPQELVEQIVRAAETLGADHAAARAKVVELRAYLGTQAREIDQLKSKCYDHVAQLKGRHFLVLEHRSLEDHVRALEERLDMQSMLLAGPAPPVQRQPAEYQAFTPPPPEFGYGTGLTVPPTPDHHLGA
jgi:hypothetical protein